MDQYGQNSNYEFKKEPLFISGRNAYRYTFYYPNDTSDTYPAVITLIDGRDKIFRFVYRGKNALSNSRLINEVIQSLQIN